MKSRISTLMQLVLPFLLLVNRASAQQITKVGCSEYRAFYLCTDKKVYAALWNGKVNGNTCQPYNITTAVVDLAGGLYQGLAVDASGYAYTLVNSSTTATKVATDASGKPFTGNVSCAAYFFSNFTVKSDGTVWHWGNDEYDQVPLTASLPAPVQLNAPAGVKFKKISCGDVLLGLTTTGDVYQWVKGNSTPTKMALPKPASDIASGNGFQLAIVPDDITKGTDGWPYGWGYDGTYMALLGRFTTPVALKSTWGITTAISKIQCCHNTTHFIDAAGQLWGMGDNASGEVGIGTEKINHAETYASPYVWDWLVNGMMVSKPVKIATGIQFSDIFSGSSFAFYHYAIDKSNKIYSWGRNKGITLGNGKAVNQEAIYPNALDILKPTVVTPMTVQTNGYDFTLYTINPGLPQIITLPTSSVTMNGSATPSTGYTIASYKWTQVSGPNTATIQDPSSPKTVISGLAAGIYTFRLQMTDNNTGTISGNVLITVLPTLTTNKAPVSSAGTDLKVTLPANTATLDGSSSSDADGSISTYKWTQVSGPSTSSIAAASSAKTSVSGLVAGTYVYGLTVTDNRGATATDQVTVTVAAAPAANKPPVANAGADQAITLPVSSVTLDGSVSKDPDGSISSWAWTKVSGPATGTITTATASTTTITGLSAGTYVFSLTVKDNSGATASDPVTVTVSPAPSTQPKPPVNNPPVADAGPDQTITLPANAVTLNAKGSSDKETSYAKLGMQWTVISGPAGFWLTNPVNTITNINKLVAGTYIVTLKVTDESGIYDMDTVRIFVRNVAVNTAPVANAGPDQTITQPVSAVTLNGSASSDPQTPLANLTFKWLTLSGPAGSWMNNSTTWTTGLNSLVAGTYKVMLRVTDPDGAWDTDTMTVTVKSANNAPIANAGGDQTITLPANAVTLNAKASSDAETPYASLGMQWTVVSGPAGYWLTNPVNTITNVNKLAAGTYVVSLKVTDAGGQSSTDNVTITVKAAAKTSAGNGLSQGDGSVFDTDAAGTDAVQVYPNPVTNSANLQLTGPYQGKSEIVLYDGKGNMVYHRSITKSSSLQQETVDMSRLAAGTYFLTISNGPGSKPISRTIVKI